MATGELRSGGKSQGELLVYVYHRDPMLHNALRSDVGQAASVVRQCVPNGDGRSLIQIGNNAGHIQWTLVDHSVMIW